MLPEVILGAAGPVEPISQLAQAVVDRNMRHPCEVVPRWARVEPVRRAQLVREEPCEWRLVLATEPRPHPIDDRADPPGDG